MKVGIEDVNKNEILKYLSYRGNKIPRDIDELIDDCINEVIEKSSFLYTLREFEVHRNNIFIEENKSTKESNKYIKSKINMDNIFLGGTDFMLDGKDIRNMLEEIEKCVVFGATLGIGVDKYIRSMQVRDMAKSVVLDSCASSIIETFCNLINREIEERYRAEGLFITDRFSPGYGDMPIESQKKLSSIMELPKKIGVNVSSSGIMIPRKSVTAIIGISEKKQIKRFSGCENCRMFLKCEYRKTGKVCKRVSYGLFEK